MYEGNRDKYSLDVLIAKHVQKSSNIGNKLEAKLSNLEAKIYKRPSEAALKSLDAKIAREQYIPDRAFIRGIGDAGAALLVGGVQIADTAYGLANITQGGIPDKIFQALDPDDQKYSQRSQQLKKAIKANLYSDELQQMEERRGVQSDYRKKLNDVVYADNALAKFASNFVGAVSEYAAAPGLAVNTAIESLPQMLIPGKLAQIGIKSFIIKEGAKNLAKAKLTGASKKVAAGWTDKYLKSNAGKKAIEKIQERTGLSYIAVSEGISNGMEVQAEILNASEEDLRASSPEYVKRRMSGSTHQEAKEFLADKAGLITTGVAGLFGLVASKISGVGKFEGSLFKLESPLGKAITAKVSNAALMRPIKKGASGLIAEGVEETLQGGGGTLAGNWAKSLTSNEKQDLLEDVADAAGQGLAIGSLSGGALGGGASLVAETAKGTVKAVKATSKGISKIGEGAKSALPETEEGEESLLQKAANVIKDVAKGTGNALKSGVEGLRELKETKISTARVRELKAAASDKTSDSYKKITDINDKDYNAGEALTVLLDKSAQPKNQEEAAEYVPEVNKHLSAYHARLVQAAKEISTREETPENVVKMEKIIGELRTNKERQARLNKIASDGLSAAELDVEVNTSEDASTIITYFGSSPKSATPKRVNKLLENKKNLTPKQVKELEDIQNVNRIVSKATNAGEVHDEIINGTPENKGYLDYDESISRAVTGNDTETAQRELTSLNNLQENQKSKLKYLDKLISLGNALTSAKTEKQREVLIEKIDKEHADIKVSNPDFKVELEYKLPDAARKIGGLRKRVHHSSSSYAR